MAQKFPTAPSVCSRILCLLLLTSSLSACTRPKADACRAQALPSAVAAPSENPLAEALPEIALTSPTQLAACSDDYLKKQTPQPSERRYGPFTASLLPKSVLSLLQRVYPQGFASTLPKSPTHHEALADLRASLSFAKLSPELPGFHLEARPLPPCFTPDLSFDKATHHDGSACSAEVINVLLERAHLPNSALRALAFAFSLAHKRGHSLPKIGDTIHLARSPIALGGGKKISHATLARLADTPAGHPLYSSSLLLLHSDQAQEELRLLHSPSLTESRDFEGRMHVESRRRVRDTTHLEYRSANGVLHVGFRGQHAQEPYQGTLWLEQGRGKTWLQFAWAGGKRPLLIEAALQNTGERAVGVASFGWSAPDSPVQFGEKVFSQFLAQREPGGAFHVTASLPDHEDLPTAPTQALQISLPEVAAIAYPATRHER